MAGSLMMRDRAPLPSMPRAALLPCLASVPDPHVEPPLNPESEDSYARHARPFSDEIDPTASSCVSLRRTEP